MLINLGHPALYLWRPAPWKQHTSLAFFYVFWNIKTIDPKDKKKKKKSQKQNLQLKSYTSGMLVVQLGWQSFYHMYFYVYI